MLLNRMQNTKPCKVILDLRIQLLDVMDATRALHAVLPSDSPSKLAPEIIRKLVDLCRCFASAEHLMSAAGAPRSLDETDAAELERCLAAGPKSITTTWTKVAIDQRRQEFDESLCKAKFGPLRTPIDTVFLPPEHTKEDLARYADATSAEENVGVADHLSIMYGIMGNSSEQGKVKLDSYISTMQHWAAKLSLTVSGLPPVSEKTTQLDSHLFVTLKHVKAAKHKADEVMQEMAAGSPSYGITVLQGAQDFLDSKVKFLGEQLVKLITQISKSAKAVLPPWRQYVLTNPDPAKIKGELIESKSTLALRALYPAMTQLHTDMIVADTEFQLHFDVTHSELVKEFTAFIAEVKLTIGVEHVCNVLYVLAPQVSKGPASKVGKAKAGLARELKLKLAKAQMLKSIPAELLTRVQNM